MYLAGATNADFNVRFKNQYIADSVFLITDALEEVSISKGSNNIRANVTDIGSIIYKNNSACIAISLSRVDPGIVFSDIDVHFNVVATNTIATQMGGFHLSSTAKLVNPYPYNWIPEIYLRNIKISGYIDRSQQTVSGNVTGDIYIYTMDELDNSQHATVENLSIDQVTIISAQTPPLGTPHTIRAAYCIVPGLKNILSFKNYYAPNMPLSLQTAESLPNILLHFIIEPNSDRRSSRR